MSTPYLVISDVHLHDWSAFGGRDSDGISLRLKIILAEIERAARVLEKAGGRDIVIAGDLYHVRGQIKPETFNPSHQLFESLTLRGFRFFAIPGNHDLSTRETTELGNAMQTLNSLDGFNVLTEGAARNIAGQDVFLMPWISTNDGLRAAIKEVLDSNTDEFVADCDLIIHAGINGVVKGLPDHGLDAEEVAGWGFKRVLAGHYHDNKSFCDGKVISIGALTHQTWSDIGSKAGFMLVYPDRYEWNASHAPHFIEITDETPEEEVPLLVDGNYVRVRGKKSTDAEINDMRRDFLELGAKGFSYQGVREVVAARGATSAHKAVSLQEAVTAFIKERKFEGVDLEAVTREAMNILENITTLEA